MTEEEIRAKFARRASRAIVGGFQPSDDPFASWFGRVRVARAGEEWPQWNGKPLMPLCQFNLTELPYRPANLADTAFMTLFLEESEGPYPIGENGDGWLLRAYPSLDVLVPVMEPSIEGAIKQLPIRWEEIEEDLPSRDDLCANLDPADPTDPEGSQFKSELYALIDSLDFETHEGIKIGGWPVTIQCEVDWGLRGSTASEIEFAFQIDSLEEADWSWGDIGVAYFGRGVGSERDRWMMDWQCC